MNVPTIQELVAMSQPERLTVFKEWLKSRQSGETFKFGDILDCIIARFGKSIDRELFHSAGPSYITFKHCKCDPLPILGMFEGLAIAQCSTVGEVLEKLA